MTGFRLPVIETNATGWPSVGGEVLRELAGKDLYSSKPRWGKAYEYFGAGNEAGCWSYLPSHGAMMRVNLLSILLLHPIHPKC